MAPSASVPHPQRTLDVTMRDGAVIRVRQHGNPDGPRLLVSHGNGLATDGYVCFWRHFLGDCEVLIYDQRNHGQNPRHRREAHGFSSFVDDLCALHREIPAAFGEKPTSGVFHSLSAIAAVAHALEHPWPWAGLVLVDPPFCPAPDEALYAAARAEENALSERAARRRSHFAHARELATKMEQGMSTHGPGWAPGAYEDMATAVLRESSAGGFELACPGGYEAKVFAENSTLTLTPRLGELAGPALFLCADPDLQDASMPALINRALQKRHGHAYHAPSGTTHMLQLEQPEPCAALTLEFLAKHGAV